MVILTFRQLRNLEKAFGGDVRVCDRTALILDIFDQRAATREAALQAYDIIILKSELFCDSRLLILTILSSLRFHWHKWNTSYHG